MIGFFVAIVVLPMMLIVAGLGIDVAALATLRDRAQLAADAAATAGAASTHFVKDVPECTVDCTGHWALNLDVPKAFASLNGFPEATIVFNPGEPSVAVTITTSLQTTLLRLIGITTLNTGAFAKAIRFNTDQAAKDQEPPAPGRSRLTI